MALVFLQYTFVQKISNTNQECPLSVKHAIVANSEEYLSVNSKRYCKLSTVYLPLRCMSSNSARIGGWSGPNMTLAIDHKSQIKQ